jgi:hypothetical protein
MINIINKKIMDITLSNTIGMVIVKKKKSSAYTILFVAFIMEAALASQQDNCQYLYFSGFFAPARYRVVKIVRSSPEVVLQTMKYTVIYPGSSPLLRGNSPTSSGLILKMNIRYKWVSRELQKFTW